MQMNIRTYIQKFFGYRIIFLRIENDSSYFKDIYE